MPTSDRSTNTCRPARAAGARAQVEGARELLCDQRTGAEKRSERRLQGELDAIDKPSQRSASRCARCASTARCSVLSAPTTTRARGDHPRRYREVIRMRPLEPHERQERLSFGGAARGPTSSQRPSQRTSSGEDAMTTDSTTRPTRATDTQPRRRPPSARAADSPLSERSSSSPPAPARHRSPPRTRAQVGHRARQGPHRAAAARASSRRSPAPRPHSRTGTTATAREHHHERAQPPTTTARRSERGKGGGYGVVSHRGACERWIPRGCPRRSARRGRAAALDRCAAGDGARVVEVTRAPRHRAGVRRLARWVRRVLERAGQPPRPLPPAPLRFLGR